MMDLEEQFNFTNKLRHPTQDQMVVYRFYDRRQADTFTELLVDSGIDFEAQVDEDDERKPTYFGVKRVLEERVDRLNYLAIGKHRDKFIAAAPIRWITLTIALVVLLLAIFGAITQS